MMLAIANTGFFFPARGLARDIDVVVGSDGMITAGRMFHGTVHHIDISIDDYLDGPIESFRMFYTYRPNDPENEAIRAALNIGWHGEVLMMIKWPGLADPNANEEEYGDYDFETGTFRDAEFYVDYDEEIDDNEENVIAAAGMPTTK